MKTNPDLCAELLALQPQLINEASEYIAGGTNLHTPRFFDNSMLNQYMEEQFGYWVKYVLGLDFEDTKNYFMFGRLFHKALDLWWQGIETDEVIAYFQKEFAPYSIEREGNVYTTVKGMNALRHYADTWKGHDLELVGDPEFCLVVPVAYIADKDVKPLLGIQDYLKQRKDRIWLYLVAPIDKLVREGDEVLPLDHKVSKRNAFDDMKHNSQFLQYIFMCNMVGVHAKRAIIDGIHIGASNDKPRRVSTDYVDSSMLDRFHLERVRIMQMIYSSLQSGIWVPRRDYWAWMGSSSWIGDCVNYTDADMWESMLREQMVDTIWNPLDRV